MDRDTYRKLIELSHEIENKRYGNPKKKRNKQLREWYERKAKKRPDKFSWEVYED